MFDRYKEPSDLDLVLKRAYASLPDHTADSEEYAKIVDQIVKLHSLKTEETLKPVSKDTWALIAANLTGIVIIVAYEHAHVITTRALGFVPKPH